MKETKINKDEKILRDLIKVLGNIQRRAKLNLDRGSNDINYWDLSEDLMVTNCYLRIAEDFFTNRCSESFGESINKNE